MAANQYCRQIHSADIEGSDTLHMPINPACYRTYTSDIPASYYDPWYLAASLRLGPKAL